MSFDIRQLRYAIAAADHGSFYRAARAMDVEQSTLSRSIIKLERSVGAKLFERSRVGVRTTIAGARFIQNARPMVASADRMVAMSRATGAGRAGSLAIGFNSGVSAGNLRATVLAWWQMQPEVEFDCVEADRAELLAGLDSGEVDIAVLSGEIALDGYRSAALWSERIYIAVSALHPLADHEPVHWTDLRSERFVLPAHDPGPYVRDMLLGRLSRIGLDPDIRLHRTSWSAILSLLGETR